MPALNITSTHVFKSYKDQVGHAGIVMFYGYLREASRVLHVLPRIL